MTAYLTAVQDDKIACNSKVIVKVGGGRGT